MPDETSHEQFKYGVPTANSEAAKNVLYPEGGEKEERPEISKLYNRTHGNFGPGEQKDRDYEWPIDKGTHRFGICEKKIINGA